MEMMIPPSSPLPTKGVNLEWNSSGIFRTARFPLNSLWRSEGSVESDKKIRETLPQRQPRDYEIFWKLNYHNLCMLYMRRCHLAHSLSHDVCYRGWGTRLLLDDKRAPQVYIYLLRNVDQIYIHGETTNDALVGGETSCIKIITCGCVLATCNNFISETI